MADKAAENFLSQFNPTPSNQDQQVKKKKINCLKKMKD